MSERLLELEGGAPVARSALSRRTSTPRRARRGQDRVPRQRGRDHGRDRSRSAYGDRQSPTCASSRISTRSRNRSKLTTGKSDRAERDGNPAQAAKLRGRRPPHHGLPDVTAAPGAARGSLEPRQRQRTRIERQKLDALLGLFARTAIVAVQVLLGYFGEHVIRGVRQLRQLPQAGARLGWWSPPKERCRRWCTPASALRRLLLSSIRRSTAPCSARKKNSSHRKLKTFGVGVELGKREWSAVFRQLVAQGHLGRYRGHGGLHLGDSGAAMLRGEVPVSFRHDEVAAVEPRAKPARASPPGGAAAPGDEALWQRLRALRREIAREQGVPPCHVCLPRRDAARDGCASDAARSRRRALAARPQRRREEQAAAPLWRAPFPRDAAPGVLVIPFLKIARLIRSVSIAGNACDNPPGSDGFAPLRMRAVRRYRSSSMSGRVFRMPRRTARLALRSNLDQARQGPRDRCRSGRAAPRRICRRCAALRRH